MGKVLQNLSYISAVYTVIGFLTLSFYYNHFHVNIMAYITVSEIILLSLPNFQEIGYSFIFLVSFLAPVLMMSVNKEFNNEKKKSSQHFMSQPQKVNLNFLRFQKRMFYYICAVTMISSIWSGFDFYQATVLKKDTNLYHLIMKTTTFISTISISFVCILVLLKVKVNFIDLLYKRGGIYVFIIIGILCTNLLFAFKKISDIESGESKIVFKINIGEETITSKQGEFIGESKDFVFLKKGRDTYIYKRENVDIISLRSR